MRVFVWSEHRYPAYASGGRGVAPAQTPSGAPQHIHDLLVKGLAELGHEVFYHPKRGIETPLPPGVIPVTAAPSDADVHHNSPRGDGKWVVTVHRAYEDGVGIPPNAVWVSRTLAHAHGSDRYVHNGLDPADYVYSEQKGDYVLFLSALQGPRLRQMYLDKGLDRALALSRRIGFPLIVAGTTMDRETLDRVRAICREAGATFVGDVRGKVKAELLAGARALLFPTRLFEGFGLVTVEAMMSGTPVIASDRGACTEIVTPDVGFTCGSDDEFADAFANLDRISPARCRERAMSLFHYRTMAAGYVREYERQIASASPAARTFAGDFDKVRDRLAARVPFAFSRFGDTEVEILRNEMHDGRRKQGNLEWSFTIDDPVDLRFREQLHASLVYRHPDYYVGLSCPHCFGVEQFERVRAWSGQDDQHLTWATLFFYANHQRFLDEIVPLFDDYDVYLVAHRSADIDRLPFPVRRFIPIDYDAGRANPNLLASLERMIRRQRINGALFLLAAGPLACVLAHRLHEVEPTNTYLDIGSALDPFFFPGTDGLTRRYLIHTETRRESCTWTC